jgi:hypothetical protein
MTDVFGSNGCGAQVSNEPQVAQKVLAGVQTLNEYLAKGYSIYGNSTDGYHDNVQ